MWHYKEQKSCQGVFPLFCNIFVTVSVAFFIQRNIFITPIRYAAAIFYFLYFILEIFHALSKLV